MTERRIKSGRGATAEKPVVASDWLAADTKPVWAHILAEETLEVHFQPIVSLKKRAIIGVEALARPTDGESGRPVTPLELFAWAGRNGRTVDLDRLCRRKALDAYSPMADTPQAPLLFLNFESSVLDQGVLGSGVMSKAVRDAGLTPDQIVIEINESKVVDMGALQEFVEIHRAQGFLFALDDLGAGFSNLARIGLLKPEVLKIDRVMVEGIEKDFHKQEVFKSLVGLGRRVGSLILAEGVETEAEVSTCVDLGADLVQGFYFGRPAAPDRLSMDLIDLHLNDAATKQHLRARERLVQRRLETDMRVNLMEELVAEMSGAGYPHFPETMEQLVLSSRAIECIYVLDGMGLQVTQTVTAPSMDAKPWTRLFYPAVKGADHSSKEYYYALVEGGPRLYTTEAYLSLASGKPCRTLSCKFSDRNGSPFILCLDIDVA
ncbi:MAG: putative signaling protein [Fibrobacteres bacterium]|nr:putative signaling protein [Fibrobacterota bacterium]